MRHISIPEHGRIPRDKVPAKVLRKLQALDERHARVAGDTVFDWGRRTHVRARNHVGLLEVPGLSIEILPKIDSDPRPATGRAIGSDRTGGLAQRNLLYMLGLTRDLPIQDRSLATQWTRDRPLLEFLIKVFVTRTLTELRRGCDHGYVRHEENLPVVKGKILMSEQVRRNINRSDLAFVQYDEFVADTWLNRILKATCRCLLRLARTARVSQYLKEALIELQDARDLTIRDEHFARVQLNRDSERFRPLLDFCRLVLAGTTPEPSRGQARTFSMTFPMERLFEEFIGRFLRRYASDFGLSRSEIHLQARHQRRWLARTPEGAGRFRLKPDIVIRNASSGTTILDTKWKRLLSDRDDAKNGVSQADIYQLYAYANRYESADNVLLYPRVPGVTPKQFFLEGDPLKRRIRIAFVDVSHDLSANVDTLKKDLRRTLGLEERSGSDSNVHSLD